MCDARYSIRLVNDSMTCFRYLCSTKWFRTESLHISRTKSRHYDQLLLVCQNVVCCHWVRGWMFGVADWAELFTTSMTMTVLVTGTLFEWPKMDCLGDSMGELIAPIWPTGAYPFPVLLPELHFQNPSTWTDSTNTSTTTTPNGCQSTVSVRRHQTNHVGLLQIGNPVLIFYFCFFFSTRMRLKQQSK